MHDCIIDHTKSKQFKDPLISICLHYSYSCLLMCEINFLLFWLYAIVNVRNDVNERCQYGLIDVRHLSD